MDLDDEIDYEKPKYRPYANYIFVFSNLLIFVICTFTGEWLYNIGIMKPLAIVEDGQWYRMITSMFLHADTDHVIGNMMLLFFLGEVVERNLGHVKYFILYMLAGIAGNVLSLLYSLWQQDYVGSLGASGAVYGMMGGLLWMLVSNHGHLEEITLPRVVFVMGYSLYLGFTSTNVDNSAHMGGLVMGFVLGMILYRKRRGKVINEG